MSITPNISTNIAKIKAPKPLKNVIVPDSLNEIQVVDESVLDPPTKIQNNAQINQTLTKSNISINNKKIAAPKPLKNIIAPDSLNKIIVAAEIHPEPITSITKTKLTENKFPPVVKSFKFTKQIPDPPIGLQTVIPTPPLPTSKLTLKPPPGFAPINKNDMKILTSQKIPSQSQIAQNTIFQQNSQNNDLQYMVLVSLMLKNLFSNESPLMPDKSDLVREMTPETVPMFEVLKSIPKRVKNLRKQPVRANKEENNPNLNEGNASALEKRIEELERKKNNKNMGVISKQSDHLSKVKKNDKKFSGIEELERKKNNENVDVISKQSDHLSKVKKNDKKFSGNNKNQRKNNNSEVTFNSHPNRSKCHINSDGTMSDIDSDSDWEDEGPLKLAANPNVIRNRKKSPVPPPQRRWNSEPSNTTHSNVTNVYSDLKPQGYYNNGGQVYKYGIKQFQIQDQDIVRKREQK